MDKIIHRGRLFMRYEIITHGTGDQGKQKGIEENPFHALLLKICVRLLS